ncbi:methyltransferase [Catenulispora subtropica]|uniref:Methyltransferase n=1 Tax=Catenulispora subtropica TaxID=450798 RepID=A0ABN2T7T2_9ACTN
MALTGAPPLPGELELTRFPEDPRERLRAWDASDEYLLRHLEGLSGSSGSSGLPAPSGRTVVFGDRWGALTTSLLAAGAAVTQISDSFLTQQATLLNVSRNGMTDPDLELLSTVDDFSGRPASLLVRVPKSLALLEDRLRRLRPFLGTGTRIVGTGMVTEIHTSTLQAFERILGPTRTSLAVRKARLIFCEIDPALAPAPSPWPLAYRLPEDAGLVAGRTVVNHAGTFSADHLDIGTRFFLQHLPRRSDAAHIVDLGCGNGVVGLAAALGSPEASVTFVDESYQAVASARATFEATFAAGTRDAAFRVGDGLAGFERESVDLVLNNPPFHAHQATTDAVAWRMFTGSRAALRPGGELWVVGNRHLGYHAKLKRLFGNCDVVAGNPKFVVLRARRRSRL